MEKNDENGFVFLHPFQQCFSYIKTMKGYCEVCEVPRNPPAEFKQRIQIQQGWPFCHVITSAKIDKNTSSVPWE